MLSSAVVVDILRVRVNGYITKEEHSNINYLLGSGEYNGHSIDVNMMNIYYIT